MTTRTTPAVFRKQRSSAPAGFFAAEAAGLRWLRVSGGPPTVPVYDVGGRFIDLERLTSVRPTPSDATEFGRRLAHLHRVDAGTTWGNAPPGISHAYFGPLDDPLPMAIGSWTSWAEFYREARLTPIAALGARRGVFTKADVAALSSVSTALLIGAAGSDPPSRLHGDLWSGNVMWTPEGVVLIDPAAHVGHREADIAMLHLFGCPYLDQILEGYQAVYPLATGWQDRLPLHWLFPVAAHAVLFGGHYADQTRGLLRRLHETPPARL